MFKQFSANWARVWPRQLFRIELAVSLIFLLTVLSLFSRFVNWVELRQGAILNDPVLAMLTPVDVTWLTFALIYLGLITAIVAVVIVPEWLVIGMQAYTLMVVFRTAAMYLIPLEAPQAMIPLQDPLVEIIGTGKLLTRDLFFSGHTATMFILFLCVPQRPLKIVLLLGTCVLAFCLLVQHVHYSVDVFAAPFFSYTAYRTVLLLHPNIKTSSVPS
ncbi:hypothetical protein JNL27_09830 [bacterium]|nr:hypothetical protein [bacterium]